MEQAMFGFKLQWDEVDRGHIPHKNPGMNFELEISPVLWSWHWRTGLIFRILLSACDRMATSVLVSSKQHHQGTRRASQWLDSFHVGKFCFCCSCEVWVPVVLPPLPALLRPKESWVVKTPLRVAKALQIKSPGHCEEGRIRPNWAHPRG